MSHSSSLNFDPCPNHPGQLGADGRSNRLTSLWDRLRKLPLTLTALAVGLGILAWAYWPNLQYLYAIWDTEPNYSHGLLVIPIALAIFWQRLTVKDLDAEDARGPWWGWGLLALVLAARAVAYERNNQWLENATIIPAVACLIFTLGGRPLLRQAWPAVLFLVFMLPLPPAANNMITGPLQRLATMGSVYFMQLTGLWTIAEGNVITLPETPHGPQTLEVARACNGLSMLMTLAATVAATIMLLPLPNWKRLVVLVSAVPIALLSNIIRIVATGWCYYLLEGEKAKEYAHNGSGWLMMPLALILVGLELLVLSWLAGDGSSRDEDARRPVLAMIPQDTGGQPKVQR